MGPFFGGRGDEEKRTSCGRRMRWEGRNVPGCGAVIWVGGARLIGAGVGGGLGWVGPNGGGGGGCDLGGAETLAWMGRNGGAPRQFVRKTDVFPTQCLLKSGFVSRISSPPFRPVRVRFRSHPNQCPAPRHVSPLPPHPPPTRRPLFL